MIKFLCKDIWILVFRKQIDNLKTNHRVLSPSLSGREEARSDRALSGRLRSHRLFLPAIRTDEHVFPFGSPRKGSASRQSRLKYRFPATNDSSGSFCGFPVASLGEF